MGAPRTRENFINSVLKYSSPEWSVTRAKLLWNFVFYPKHSWISSSTPLYGCGWFHIKGKIWIQLSVEFSPRLFFFCWKSEAKMTNIYYDVVICNIIIDWLFITWFLPQHLSTGGQEGLTDTGAVTHHIGDATPIFVERIT